ncbi:uncharacterized protein H6S33_008771 [Morchella sextelata]|uniref:uncharacterized protein n=1 Tax=Morchella sextelata TaxID=1174677 RepID=UPI001D0467AB|nr:uncharacterized protein H6S33_008771 [Morchella sextelata]KAH0602432.1 hypothetical protein H6S33_008771 [Morchella sextelata]
MPYESPLPPIDVPPTSTIYNFLFGPTSTIATTPASSTRSFIDAATDARISFPELKQLTTHLSTALTRHYGLRPGETVALFSTNTIWYPVAMYGVLRAGGVVSGASPAYTVDEMAYALEKSKARSLFTLPGSLKVALAAAERVGMEKKRVFLLEGRAEGIMGLRQLVEMGRRVAKQTPEWVVPEGKGNGEAVAFLSFSSGTTGLPKAVMISHRNVIAQCLQLQKVTTPDLNRVLAALPLFHITGLVHILHLPLLVNADVVMLPQFTLPKMLTAVADYKIPEMLLVPPILIRLIRDPIVANYDLKHVKRLSSGAAPLSREVIKELENKFPWMGLKHGYGMTESCSCITATLPGDTQFKHGHKVGKLCASTQVKIVDENGAEVPRGQPGELLAKGPQVTMGYLENEKATRETYDNEGWLHTGDVAVIDEDGHIEIVERIKEMIKVNGVQVAPAELEDLLLGHPKVEDVAVLGVPHETMGEVPRAYVVLKAGVKQDGAEEELVDYVKKSRGAKDKWLRGGVRFIESVPKSPSGKILRRVLRDKAKMEDKVVEKAKL